MHVRVRAGGRGIGQRMHKRRTHIQLGSPAGAGRRLDGAERHEDNACGDADHGQHLRARVSMGCPETGRGKRGRRARAAGRSVTKAPIAAGVGASALVIRIPATKVEHAKEHADAQRRGPHDDLHGHADVEAERGVGHEGRCKVEGDGDEPAVRRHGVHESRDPPPRRSGRPRPLDVSGRAHSRHERKLRQRDERRDARRLAACRGRTSGSPILPVSVWAQALVGERGLNGEGARRRGAEAGKTGRRGRERGQRT